MTCDMVGIGDSIIQRLGCFHVVSKDFIAGLNGRVDRLIQPFIYSVMRAKCEQHEIATRIQHVGILRSVVTK